jgi:hypothetical protein
MTFGFSSGMPSPPGPPAGSKNSAITGGTGAFFGVRGQKGQRNGLLSGATSERVASITEDPANSAKTEEGTCAPEKLDTCEGGGCSNVLLMLRHPRCPSRRAQ